MKIRATLTGDVEVTSEVFQNWLMKEATAPDLVSILGKMVTRVVILTDECHPNKKDQNTITSLDAAYFAIKAAEKAMSCVNNCKYTLSVAEEDLIRNCEFIPAIKSVRERLGIGLKDAKDCVDAWRLKHGY